MTRHYPDLACDTSSVWNFCARFSDVNSPFAASHSRGKKLPYWRAKAALGQDKQKAYIILNGNFLCLSCPSATYALQYGSFVPRDWQAAKGLLHNFEWLFSFVCYVPVRLLLSSTAVFVSRDWQAAKGLLHNFEWLFSFVCCPSATFALQYGSFVPRDWQAAKGLFAGKPNNGCFLS